VLRTVVLLALLGLGAWFARSSYSTMQDDLRAVEVCDMASAGDRDGLEALSLPPMSSRAPFDAAFACRCLFLLVSGDTPACVQDMERAMAQDPRWVPDVELLTQALIHWRLSGSSARALAAARRGLEEHPGEPRFVVESLLADDGDDVRQRAEETARLWSGRDDVPVAHLLGLAVLVFGEKLGEHGRGAELLWQRVPSLPHDEEGRAIAFSLGQLEAQAGRQGGVDRACKELPRLGGTEVDRELCVTAHVAWNDLADAPTRLGLMAAVMAKTPSPEWEGVRGSLLGRYAQLHLLLSGAETAKEKVEEFKEHLPEAYELAVAMIEESVRAQPATAGKASVGRGQLRFEFEAPVAGVLQVSDSFQAFDARYTELPIEGPVVVVAREVLGSPTHWVVRDAEGLRASGTVWVSAGETVPVRVKPQPPRKTPPVVVDVPPADGRRHALVLLLDSVDWRIARYAMTRGDMPALASLVQRGASAVIRSTPPSTSAALAKLQNPGPRPRTLAAFLVEISQQLAVASGSEEAAPSALNAFVTDRGGLPEALAARDLSTALLLRGHGAIKARTTGSVITPDGAGEPIPWARFASLDDEVRGRWEAEKKPLLERVPEERRERLGRQLDQWFTELTAMFDSTELAWARDDVDLVLAHVDPTDFVAHVTYGDYARAGQDDGHNAMLAVYRAVDARIARLLPRVDADDLLVVVSDHGTQSSFVHAEEAFFAAVGPGIEAHRMEGEPRFRTVPSLLAHYFGGPEPTWPSGGVDCLLHDCDAPVGDAGVPAPELTPGAAPEPTPPAP
jgi:hypothetical protein